MFAVALEPVTNRLPPANWSMAPVETKIELANPHWGPRKEVVAYVAGNSSMALLC